MNTPKPLGPASIDMRPELREKFKKFDLKVIE
jgi:hypothetical protein